MISMQETLNTIGDGYWSNVAKSVAITGANLSYINENKDFGELRVYFDTKTWDVRVHGLIYTDSKFLNELQDLLVEKGFNASGIDYSEQGMQGEDYVSFDVDKSFIDSWTSKFSV